MPGYGTEKYHILIGDFMSISLDKVKILVYSVYAVRKGSESSETIYSRFRNREKAETILYPR